MTLVTVRIIGRGVASLNSVGSKVAFYGSLLSLLRITTTSGTSTLLGGVHCYVQNSGHDRLTPNAFPFVSRRDESPKQSVTIQIAGKWRERFLTGRLGALEEAPGSGRPRKINDQKVEDVITRRLEMRSQNGTHWSIRNIAEVGRFNQNAIVGIRRAFGLKPHFQENFRLSTDPSRCVPGEVGQRVAHEIRARLIGKSEGPQYRRSQVTPVERSPHLDDTEQPLQAPVLLGWRQLGWEEKLKARFVVYADDLVILCPLGCHRLERKLPGGFTLPLEFCALSRCTRTSSRVCPKHTPMANERPIRVATRKSAFVAGISRSIDGPPKFLLPTDSTLAVSLHTLRTFSALNQNPST